jgi:multisubunit Na+/H+ antiporter MnhG subunit
MAEHGHGHSTAAWTAVTILLVGAFLLSLAVVVQSRWLAIAGIVLVVVGPVAGKILSMAGYGQAKPRNARGTTAVR